MSTLSHQCPQCGAPVELETTDRIFTCPFCQVRLFIYARGPLEYYIKPRISSEGTLLYLPYWRLRGNAFALTPSSIQHKILDSSLLATKTHSVPPTLGLRAQAMALHFVEPATLGSFVRPDISSTILKMQLLKSIPGLVLPNEKRLMAYIGDSLSLIYQPVYQQTHGLIDGLTGNMLGSMDLSQEGLQPASSSNSLSFVSTLCPQCGWDLHGHRQSLVQTCPHCDTAWEAGPEQGRQISLRFMVSDYPADLFLPFWNLDFTTTGFKLQTWTELIQLTNLPRVPQPWMHSTAFSFRIPAFKIRPELFLNLASTISLHQPSNTTTTMPKTALHPVTLPKSEAFEAIPVVLGRIAPARKNLFARLQGGRISPRKATLEYIPFVEQKEEYLQPEIGTAILKSALHWSTTL